MAKHGTENIFFVKDGSQKKQMMTRLDIIRRDKTALINFYEHYLRL
jgi:hypothetical protein